MGRAPTLALMGHKGGGSSLWENTQELRSVEVKQKCLNERQVGVGTRRADNEVAVVTGPLRLPPGAVIPPGGSTAQRKVRMRPRGTGLPLILLSHLPAGAVDKFFSVRRFGFPHLKSGALFLKVLL